MSGIAGILNLDGSTVNRKDLERMAETLAHRGPDGPGFLCNGPVGLACQMLRVTPESNEETQPILHPSKTCIIWDGRLDDRNDLIASLGRDPGLLPKLSDPALLLEAYQTFGENLPERLKGEFAFAIWDPVRRRLLLARDAIGIRPLYYFRDKRRFLFASEIKAILCHPEVSAQPNSQHLGEFLIDRIQDQEMTFFQGIFSLLPAHLLMVTPEVLSKRRYWDFDLGAQVGLRSFHEYGEVFREVFATAIRRRLRSSHPVAVSVSGGLDSSSIFCLASKEAKRVDRPPHVLGISYTTPDGSPSDEKKYLVEIEKSCGLTIHRVPLGPQRFLESAPQQVWHAEFPSLDEQWGSTHNLLSCARGLGARVILTGHWGDQFLFPQAYLVDLFRSLRWRELYRHLREFSLWMTDADPKCFRQAFYMDMVKYHLPAMFHPLARKFLKTHVRPWFSRPFQRQAFKRSWTLKAFRGQKFRSIHSQSLYEQARTAGHVLSMEWENKIASMHGLEISFPFLDRDVISFLMAVPGEILNHQGVPKALLREAMKGVLPEAIAQRRWKADFTHLVNKALEGDFSGLIQKLDSGRMAQEFGYLDSVAFHRQMGSLRNGFNQSAALSAWDLSALLGLETWLEAFFSKQALT